MYLTIPRYCNRCGKKFIYGIDENELHNHKGTMTYLCDECAIGTAEYVPPVIVKRENMLRLTKEQFANLPTVNQIDYLSKLRYVMAGRTPEGAFQEYPKSAHTRVEKYCNECGKRFIYESEHMWEPDPIYLCEECK